MFKLQPKNDEGASLYWYPVEVSMLDDDGRKRKFKFDARFKRLPQTELEELMKSIREGAESGNAIKDREILDKIFVGWREVQDANGEELAVNDENRDRLLEAYPVQPTVLRAWFKSVGAEGTQKN